MGRRSALGLNIEKNVVLVGGGGGLVMSEVSLYTFNSELMSLDHRVQEPPGGPETPHASPGTMNPKP